MQHLAIGVKHNEYRETETCRIVKTLHQTDISLCRFFASSLAWIVVDVQVDEVVVNHLVDSLVFLGKIGKSQTPWTPVAAYLANYILG